MISIAICDDEMLHCLDIENKMKNILQESKMEYTITKFFSAAELINALASYDIIFLDIQMGGLNGIEAAKQLRAKGYRSILIFITSDAGYMAEAFDVEAFHYLLKPIDTKKLKAVLGRAVDKRLPSQEEYLVVSQNRQTIKLLIGEILYFEIMGRIIKAYLINQEIEFYEQISVLERKLPTDTFYRCHKSYLVNLAFIKSFEKLEITLDNGQSVPLSKRKADEFKKIFMSFVKKEGGII